MIGPLQACRLVQAAYDPIFQASGAIPDLSPLGCVGEVHPLYAQESGQLQRFGFLVTLLDGSQVIALRGTQNIQDAMSDANIHMVANRESCPGLVHRGFRAITDTLGVGPTLIPIVALVSSLAGLTVAGHSLGGAIARQLSIQLGHIGQVFTWGEPRSCDGAAAGYALSCTTVNRRAINAHDPIPMVPNFDPCDPLDGYRHVGEPLVIGHRDFFLGAHELTTYLALETELVSQAPQPS